MFEKGQTSNKGFLLSKETFYLLLFLFPRKAKRVECKVAQDECVIPWTTD
jgi:hypothetical protein